VIIAFLVLIPLLILSLWIFFKYSPKGINAQVILAYNLTTFVVGVVLSIIYSLYLRESMINGSDYGWWPVLSFIFSFVITIGTLFVSGILRNFIIFRNK